MTQIIDRLNEVEQWLNTSEWHNLQLGVMATKLLSSMSEAETGDEWRQSVDLAHLFLNRVSAELADVRLSNPQLARLFSILLTISVEAGQYRYETLSGESARGAEIREQLLPAMGKVREHAIDCAKAYLSLPVFSAICETIKDELFPLLDSLGDTSGSHSSLSRDRYMPFRVIQAGNIAERLYGFRLRTNDPNLVGGAHHLGLLLEIYHLKYARFGTSGVRGIWGEDFTEIRAKRVVQAICDFLQADDVPSYVNAEDLQGKRIVIGYDSRRNAYRVAEWVAEVCLANGFSVDLASRDTPTPALVYYMTDYLAADEVAALINCTASHNPPEWQGIKFNPRQGYPAPSNVTDFIAARANHYQLMGVQAANASLEDARSQGTLREFDPSTHYINWLFAAGKGDHRISLNTQRIKEHFGNGKIIVDEMHGASRGYFPRILGQIGVRFDVLHAERNPDIPGLDYANPEEPFINQLKQAVGASEDAVLGLAMDTDADRFGVVDGDGVYYRPNQVLPMLLRYLGVDRGLTGRVIATQTGSPMLEVLAGAIPNNQEFHPEPNVIPAFVDHPFYYRNIGEREDRVFSHTFMVPVGIKYIEEQRRTNRRYQTAKPLPENWRDTILIGGEESSGLTTRGHVTDKDGIWANLLIMDMVAYYGKSMKQIWQDTVAAVGFNSYGGQELDSPPSNAGRADVDAILEAKEALIDYFLEQFPAEPIDGQHPLAGLTIVYSGGIRYDFVESQFMDEGGDDRHYLRVRSSGTEPINRIYVESTDPAIARRLRAFALTKLEGLSAAQIEGANSLWRLANILSATTFSGQLLRSVNKALGLRHSGDRDALVDKLRSIYPTLERRNRRITQMWITNLT